MTRRTKLIAAALAAPLFLVGVLPADAAPGATKRVAQLQVPAKVQVSLQALDRLRAHGYRWTTDAGALKAIKAWQRANGLEPDGIVGPLTMRSLGLDAASSSVPAQRSKAAVPASQPAPPPATQGNVEAVIRDVWQGEAPDDIDRIVRIAKRESSLVPTAHNSCCYGILQIHFRAHRAWLASYGVTQPSDLYDPRVNATVALALFHQVGWEPWDCNGQCVDV